MFNTCFLQQLFKKVEEAFEMFEEEIKKVEDVSDMLQVSRWWQELLPPFNYRYTISYTIGGTSVSGFGGNTGNGGLQASDKVLAITMTGHRLHKKRKVQNNMPIFFLIFIP